MTEFVILMIVGIIVGSLIGAALSEFVLLPILQRMDLL